MGTRLKQVSQGFQKVKFMSMTFEVQTQVGTNVTGGYVMASSQDPQYDIGSGETALRNLTNMQGAKTSKNWQSSKYVHKCGGKVLFTAPGSDIRLSSPGRFYMYSDGSNSEDITVTILTHWKVRLSCPANQRLISTQPRPRLLCSTLRVSAGDAHLRGQNMKNDGTITDMRPPGEKWSAYDMGAAWSGIPVEAILAGMKYLCRVPNPFPFATGPGSSTATIGEVSMVNFILFEASADATYVQASMLETANVINARNLIYAPASTSNYFFAFWQGDYLIPVTTSEFTGNEDVAFLVNVLPSVSPMSRDMISKELLVIKPPTSPQTQMVIAELSKKFSALDLN